MFCKDLLCSSLTIFYNLQFCCSLLMLNAFSFLGGRKRDRVTFLASRLTISYFYEMTKRYDLVLRSVSFASLLHFIVPVLLNLLSTASSWSLNGLFWNETGQFQEFIRIQSIPTSSDKLTCKLACMLSNGNLLILRNLLFSRP